MEIVITLENRLYNDIKGYCETNSLDISNYIVDLITERHQTTKFGDLNDIINDVVANSTVESVKRVSKTTKEPIIEKTDENSTINDKDEKVVEQKVQRKKRTLKTL